MGDAVALSGLTEGRSDAGAECTVCGDVGVPGTVLKLDPGTATATLQLGGEIRAVAVDLLDDLKVGDVVLIHAGVAIARVEAGEGERGGR